MYFVILWKNKQISLKELELVSPINLKMNWNVVMFDTQIPQSISNLWWIIKRWIVMSQDWEINDEFTKIIKNYDLIWVNDNYLWKQLKKDCWVKRYKIVELNKTDLEIKNWWIEIIDIDWKNIWVVKWYQNINIYEIIDFEKPVRWMEIWMMPAKLTHILLNIWLWLLKDKDNCTIYDPFVWFGTTWFLVNYLWYDFIWTDINITSFKQNIKWWQNSQNFNKDKKMTIFKHDIKDKFDKMFLKTVNLVVTEWRLWPTISNRTQKNELEKNQDDIFEIYKKFIQNINNFYDNIVLVFTIPVYIWKDNFVSERLKALFEELSLKYEFIDEIYARKEHKVGRQIVLVTKN